MAGRVARRVLPRYLTRVGEFGIPKTLHMLLRTIGEVLAENTCSDLFLLTSWPDCEQTNSGSDAFCRPICHDQQRTGTCHLHTEAYLSGPLAATCLAQEARKGTLPLNVGPLLYSKAQFYL